MHTLDAVHLNVGGSGRAGNRRDGRSLQAFEPRDAFWHCLDYLIGKYNAQVVIGNQSERTPSIARCVAKDDGAGKGDGCGAPRDDSFAQVHLLIRQSIDRWKTILRGQPLLRQMIRTQQTGLSPLFHNRGHCGGNAGGIAVIYAGIVIA